MNKDALGYYNILGINKNTDEATIKINYREKAKQWHPDHNTNPNAIDVFQKISVAYEILKNKKTKIIYDMLSLIYTSKDFPDLQTIKIYKNNKGQETPFLRVFNVVKYTKKGFVKDKIIGDFNDISVYLQTTMFNNWTKGWFKPIENIKAIKFNIKNINKNTEDNFKMLIHNSVAYFKEDKKELAYMCAKEALLYANDAQKEEIYNFFNMLPNVEYKTYKWDYDYLANIQKKPKKILVICFVCVFLALIIFKMNIKQYFSQTEKINYYQEVRFSEGSETFDDMILSKVFNIPVDYNDDSMLFYVKKRIPIMYGPSDSFDVLVTTQKNQTVRVTGYTPDKKWYRIMIDNGNMGFVKKQYIKQGVGNPIPENSKIIKNERW